MSEIALVKLPWIMHKDTKQRPTGKLFNFISTKLNNSLPVLASFLRQHGIEVSIHHLKRPEDIIDIETDVYCFSLCSVDVSSFIETRSFIEKGSIIIGGPHSSFDMSLLDFSDSIVIGEGETGLLRAISDLNKGKISKVYKEPFIEDLDTLPSPAWDMIDGSSRMLTIISSRGCPFRCTFCVTSKLYGRKWRAMSPKRILHEISNNNKCKIVIFQDDNFTLSAERIWEFLRLKREMGLNFKWFCFSRTDTIVRNPQLFEAMADEGCKMIYLGVESASDEILNNVQKGTNRQINRAAIKILRDCGIEVWTSVMIGPNDSKDTARKLEEFCIWAEPILHSTSITTPFIGTDLFHDMEHNGRLLHKKWDLYDGAHCVFQPYHLTPAQVEHLSFQIDEAVWSTIGWHKRLFEFPRLMNMFPRLINMFIPSILGITKKL